jgi:hypothetical protein
MASRKKTSHLSSVPSRRNEGREVKSMCSELLRSFEKERWEEMIETLERVSEVGEKNGRREISIQAQSLRFSIESRTSVSDSTPFREMTDQFEELVSSLKQQLSHLAWTKDVSV